MTRRKRTSTEIGAYEARSRFGELLSEVEKQGVSITITRRGVPVAKLVPARSETSRPRADVCASSSTSRPRTLSTA